ncbi:hypothetical protein Gotri_025172 [Gossypium trilobum]|uniref:phosphogluconate dehydrogenase (NADP(+)-dependent, decarboxylating) n=1 Tax=Gossypium trilobum TaxID=34281 RepID=A0A7J9FNJ4_9ROSI|nr:hypothetical protein [Gossypium trilobum]
MGVSGGEEGARRGPLLMPGGSYKAYKYIKDILLKVAAQVTHRALALLTLAKEDPLIAEAYDVLKSAGKLSNDELRQVFSKWNNGELLSFLIEITADIFGIKDDKGEGYLVDKVLDKTGMKSTGKWTVQQAAELSVAAPTIALSPDSRFLSGLKDERIEAAKVFTSRGLGGVMADVAIDKNNSDLERGMHYPCCFLGPYKECIIHALSMHNPEFAKGIMEQQSAWRKVVSFSINSGISMPSMSSTLACFDSYRRERLLDNLVQAQKDYF